MDPTMRLIVIISMMLDMGWKIFTEKTKHMTPAELDDFITNKEQSVADVKAEIEAKYATP